VINLGFMGFRDRGSVMVYRVRVSVRISCRVICMGPIEDGRPISQCIN